MQATSQQTPSAQKPESHCEALSQASRAAAERRSDPPRRPASGTRSGQTQPSPHRLLGRRPRPPHSQPDRSPESPGSTRAAPPDPRRRRAPARDPRVDGVGPAPDQVQSATATAQPARARSRGDGVCGGTSHPRRPAQSSPALRGRATARKTSERQPLRSEGASEGKPGQSWFARSAPVRRPNMCTDRVFGSGAGNRPYRPSPARMKRPGPRRPIPRRSARDAPVAHIGAPDAGSRTRPRRLAPANHDTSPACERSAPPTRRFDDDARGCRRRAPHPALSPLPRGEGEQSRVSVGHDTSSRCGEVGQRIRRRGDVPQGAAATAPHPSGTGQPSARLPLPLHASETGALRARGASDAVDCGVRPLTAPLPAAGGARANGRRCCQAPALGRSRRFEQPAPLSLFPHWPVRVLHSLHSPVAVACRFAAGTRPSSQAPCRAARSRRPCFRSSPVRCVDTACTRPRSPGTSAAGTPRRPQAARRAARPRSSLFAALTRCTVLHCSHSPPQSWHIRGRQAPSSQAPAEQLVPLSLFPH